MQWNWTVFLLGIIGGLLAEVLKWYQLRESPTPPTYLKSVMYWIITLVMALVGGLLAVIQNVPDAQPILALNIGISAPLILKGLAAAVPIKPVTETAPSFGSAGPKKASIVDMIAGR
jgi:hypothetical protein